MYTHDFEDSSLSLGQTLPGVVTLLLGVPIVTTLVMTAVEYVRTGAI